MSDYRVKIRFPPNFKDTGIQPRCNTASSCWYDDAFFDDVSFVVWECTCVLHWTELHGGYCSGKAGGWIQRAGRHREVRAVAVFKSVDVIRRSFQFSRSYVVDVTVFEYYFTRCVMCGFLCYHRRLCKEFSNYCIILTRARPN